MNLIFRIKQGYYNNAYLINSSKRTKRTIFISFNFILDKVQLLFLKKSKSNITMLFDSSLDRTVWDPTKIFDHHRHCKYAVLILNSPLYWKGKMLLDIWKQAQINVTVDGGTCRWLHYLEQQGIDLLSDNYSEYVPHLITGDMDSCPRSTLEKLKDLGSTIVETPDQDYSDYAKALVQVAQYAKKKNIKLDMVYVFVNNGGRFDHTMGNINMLYKSRELIEQVEVIQVASTSLTWLLRPGFHSIIIPKVLVQNKISCGLLPIGAPVNSIETTGLQWNLNNVPLQFGGLVSSSNTYSDTCSEVNINTDSPVIWTMGIEPIGKSTDDYKLA